MRNRPQVPLSLSPAMGAAITGGLVADLPRRQMPKRRRHTLVMFATMLPGVLLTQGCETPLPGANSVSHQDCLFPDHPALLLPGFDPVLMRVIDYKRSDFDGDGHMDVVLLTAPQPAAAEAPQGGSSTLDVLSCQAPGEWKSLLHASLMPLEDTRLLVCDCNWLDDPVAADQAAALGDQGSSIIVLSRSTGASGWTLALAAFGFSRAVVRPLFNEEVHNGEAGIEEDRFVVKRLPTGLESAQGIPITRWTYRRSATDGAFTRLDLPSDPGGLSAAVAPAQDGSAAAAVATAMPAPAFTELSFCTEDGFDPLQDRCRESRSSFDGDTKRLFYSWYPTGTQAGMLYGQTWWLDGVTQSMMSSPPQPAKMWDGFIWRNAEYNYDFIDGCSRDDKKVCADSLVAGEYRVALTLDGVRVAAGQFTIGR